MRDPRQVGAQRGDKVRIVETRPLSKAKRWRVAEILGKAAVAEEILSDGVPA